MHVAEYRRGLACGNYRLIETIARETIACPVCPYHCIIGCPQMLYVYFQQHRITIIIIITDFSQCELVNYNSRY